MSNIKFKDDASKLIDVIQKKLPEATYISLLLFKNGKLIKSVNNNYNGWADSYSAEDMEHDNIFYEISHKKIKKSNSSICIWNSIPHDSKSSHEIDERRIKYGLYNGVTLLESISGEYTLGINITSNEIVNEDVFYSKVILKRKIFMSELQKLLIFES